MNVIVVSVRTREIQFGVGGERADCGGVLNFCGGQIFWW